MDATSTLDEDDRTRCLVEAEQHAAELFAEIDRRGLISPGRWESEVSLAVRDLGADLFGTSQHWHKRVVRSGENTLQPYQENPPDRRIGEDDIVFVDLGPVFAAWEADVGRTFVLGDDARKHRLAADLPRVWEAGRAFFDERPDVTGEELYAHMGELAREAGWEFGGPHSGHLVGEFPHELIDAERLHSYITTGNDTAMHRAVDAAGRRCHWILEVHLVDREHRIGGFFEQLMG
ncbi:aminopeptidase P family protein [Actinomycetospora endophytica]|uniref:Aminopeptidase P family protein n=1 Tax=Actinomycetospora endophytica TaxID=2291215 RepID=A0ABS8PAG2_9PSEU|nr:M24 family metallopeptidase [Actinomycetospora endophytica]MCD2194510.1 aminopeptidase P family protein [Actinomycetospora endophytica]